MSQTSESQQNHSSARAAGSTESTMPASYYAPEEANYSLWDVLLVLVRHRWMIAATTGACLAIGIIIAVLPQEPSYRSHAVVIREASAENELSSVSGFRQLGLNLGSAQSGLTAQAYPEIMLSREVCISVVRDTFYLSSRRREMRLVDYLTEPKEPWYSRLGVGRSTATVASLPKEGAEPHPAASANGDLMPTPHELRAAALAQKFVDTKIDQKTGLMTISAVTPDASLAAGIIESFIRHLEERVREFRTEKARQNLSFIEDRFSEVEEELEAAEEDLARFMDRNTSVQSAQLMTERDRLARKVELKTQLYANLQTQLTQAQIDLQRSNPVITVLESPIPPRSPLPQTKSFTVIFGGILGLMLGIGIAFVRSIWNTPPERQSDREKRKEMEEKLKGDKERIRRVIGRNGNGRDEKEHERRSDSHAHEVTGSVSE